MRIDHVAAIQRRDRPGAYGVPLIEKRQRGIQSPVWRRTTHSESQRLVGRLMSPCCGGGLAARSHDAASAGAFRCGPGSSCRTRSRKNPTRAACRRQHAGWRKNAPPQFMSVTQDRILRKQRVTVPVRRRPQCAARVDCPHLTRRLAVVCVPGCGGPGCGRPGVGIRPALSSRAGHDPTMPWQIRVPATWTGQAQTRREPPGMETPSCCRADAARWGWLVPASRRCCPARLSRRAVSTPRWRLPTCSASRHRRGRW